MTDDQTQFEIPSGPNPKHPDWIFRDGKGLGCVRCMPVVVPTWGTRGAHYDFDEGLLLMLAAYLRQLWWRKVLRDNDERWKVVVSRSRRRIPFFCRTLAIEFCDTEDEAEVRQVALLRAWPTSGYANAKPLSRRERRSRRLTSLQSHPRRR